MTQQQWSELLAVIRGEPLPRPPVGFIIDCPWLPGRAGLEIADYLTSETIGFEANRKALETFPDITFLPGFQIRNCFCAPAKLAPPCNRTMTLKKRVRIFAGHEAKASFLHDEW